MNLKLFTVLLCTFEVIKTAKGLKTVGDACTLNKGQPGVCGGYKTCKSMLVGQTPKVCSYAPDQAIVCCPIVKIEKRIAVQKCEEYIKQSTKKETIQTLSLIPQKQTYQIPKCDFTQELIVGGEKAKPGEFQHMVALGYPDEEGSDKIEFNCGGSLISEKYVLTAAHCKTNFAGLEPTVARLGAQNLVHENVNAHPVDYEIQKFINHPDRMAKLSYNDIALILLKQEVRFTKSIKPACLYAENDLVPNKYVLATGWGVLESYDDPSEELMKVRLQIIDQSSCEAFYKNVRTFKDGVLDTQFCAGELKGGKDTCQGDSGGPLQIQVNSTYNKCIYHVLGVTSVGIGCGEKGTAGIYTRVSAYLDWIEEIVWK